MSFCNPNEIMNKKTVFKLGTRKSPLALWQAERVSALLKTQHPNITVEIVKIVTSGDKILDKPLVQVGGKGIFTKEIEEAMLAGDIDFAVHSFKDVPTELPDGLGLSCIPERSSPFDALFTKGAASIADMPENPTIATGSLRRKAQILNLRPDANVIDIRGNVNTRLQKFHDSHWDGFIMAHAAAMRMEWEDKVKKISPQEILPAPAQGALAIETRIDDQETIAFLSSIHNEPVSHAILAEREFLASMEGGCQVPVGAYASQYGDSLSLTGLIATLDGKQLIRKTGYGSAEFSQDLGKQVAETVLKNGGLEIKESLIQANAEL